MSGMQARRTEAETFRAAPSGRRILAADGCASSLSNPACCFSAVWVPAGRGEWRSPCSDTLVWAYSSAELRALSWRISIHALEYLLTISPPCGSPPWSIFHRLVGNQIADSVRIDSRLGARGP